MTAFWHGYRVMGAISPEVIEQYGELVPVTMEEAWTGAGAATTADGFVRLIDPGLLLPVMDAILPSHPGALPVFATAWGDLLVQHEDTFVLVLYRYGFYTEFSDDATDLVFYFLEQRHVQEAQLQRKFYDDAVAALGEPAVDECFGFKLPLAAGGSEDLGNVARRKLKEHLVFLVQADGAPRDLDEIDPPEPVRIPQVSGAEALPEAARNRAEMGVSMLDKLLPDRDFGVEHLPDPDIVHVWQTGFGGAQLLIGVVELAILYGTSALGREQMVEAWRSGRRTPVDDIFAAIGQGRRQPYGVFDR